jgi:hypothetical protein
MTSQIIGQTPAQPEIAPASVLLFAAKRAFSNEKEPLPGMAKLNHDLVVTVLAAATSGGFKQSDILETMLSKGECSDRVKAMAEEACDAAGLGAIRVALERLLAALVG